MKQRRVWTSVMGVAALAIALSGGSCSGGGGGKGGGDDGGTGQDSTGGGGGCATDSDCTSKLPPTTPASCATGKCDALQGTCTFVAKDNDKDGDPAANCKSNNGEPVKDGGDCNDNDPNIYSGHPESCSELSDGGSVTSPCKPGQKSCLADGTESACTGTLVCVDQACVGGSCQGSCAPGATGCNALQPQTCDSTGAWQDTGAPCPDVCTNGSCTGVCVPGSVQCNGSVKGQPQTCDSAGTWQNTGGACPILCSNGTCTGSCTPGSTECNGSVNGQPQTCDSTGAWQNTGSPCQYVCTGGSSSPDAGSLCTGVCLPGAMRCGGSGNVVQKCDNNGNWATYTEQRRVS